VARSDTCGQKRSGGGFEHGCQWRARRGGSRAVGAAQLRPRRYRPVPLWRRCMHGVGTGAWQPRGNVVLTGGPGAERETDRWDPAAAIFELKKLPDENS
jgi:hypothetical protein